MLTREQWKSVEQAWVFEGSEAARQKVSACLEGMVSLDDVEKHLWECWEYVQNGNTSYSVFWQMLRARLQQGEASATKRSLSEVCEELCPGVRKRNWAAWAGPYREKDEPLPEPKMTQDEEDSIVAPAPAEQDAGLVEIVSILNDYQVSMGVTEAPPLEMLAGHILAVARARIREESEREVRAERVRSRMMGIEDAIHAFSDESLVTENKALHTAIENFWKCQVSGHQCGCDEWPECKHTLDAHDLRKIAMGVDRPGCRTAQPAKEGKG